MIGSGLANDLGQPELVYRFMDLANHAAALNSSRGAAFGFAGIARLAGEQLAPYVAAMVPKLYRYAEPAVLVDVHRDVHRV